MAVRATPTIFAIAALLSGSPIARGAQPVDYAREIKPLLAKHCYACHGSKKQESGLRLDSVAAVLRGGESGPAIVPGKSGDSLLYLAVSGSDLVDRMPLKAKPLDEADITLLKTWIDEGAKAPGEAAPGKLAPSAPALRLPPRD
jgi:mono/diheme cytochrome c family protein